jgi:hypothetical protein
MLYEVHVAALPTLVEVIVPLIIIAVWTGVGRFSHTRHVPCKVDEPSRGRRINMISH